MHADNIQQIICEQVRLLHCWLFSNTVKCCWFKLVTDNKNYTNSFGKTDMNISMCSVYIMLIYLSEMKFLTLYAIFSSFQVTL